MFSSAALQILLFPLPWSVRRRALVRLLGFEIDPTARIGFSVITARHLKMGPRASIHNFTLFKGMESVELQADALIGSFDWIYAVPLDSEFMIGMDRRTALVLERGANIANRHLIDCSDEVRLCEFCTMGGAHTQIQTRQVDVVTATMVAKPVTIGAYSLVTTRCVLLPGASMPSRSVLAAGSVLRAGHTEEYQMLSGVPAERVATLPADSAFFSRTRSRIY